jgi:hypothetical protein
MATFSITIDFTVEAQDQDTAISLSKQIIEAAKMEDLIERANVLDIEMLDDGETDEINFNEDDE